MKFEPIQDKYWQNRESYSEFLNIYCEKCGKYQLTYQKDGPGNLMRMYLDRIHAPEKFKGLQNKRENISDLICDDCGRLMATPRIYEKENRLAYFIFAYTVITQSSDGTYPPAVDRIDIPE